MSSLIGTLRPGGAERSLTSWHPATGDPGIALDVAVLVDTDGLPGEIRGCRRRAAVRP